MADGISELDQEFLNLFNVAKIEDGLKKTVINAGFEPNWNQILQEYYSKLEEIRKKLTFHAQYKIIVPLDFDNKYLDQVYETYKNKQDVKFDGLWKVKEFINKLDDSYKLIPGHVYEAPVWFVNEAVKVSFLEVIIFLEANNVQLPGTYGMTMLWEQNKKLPKNKWYVGINKKENSPIVNGVIRVLCVRCYSVGFVELDFGHLEGDCRDYHCIFGLRDLGPVNQTLSFVSPLDL